LSFDSQMALWAGGTPRPQGSIAFKGMRGNKPILTSDNVNLAGWRAQVTAAARAALPSDWTPLDEPVAVSLDFRLPAPQRRRWWLPAVKPDLDKLIRAVLDSLADAGVILNDSRVVEFGRTRKLYADEEHPPGVAVVVEWDLA
jgi:Holliday junction resolvase RusA-like endonuclease